MSDEKTPTAADVLHLIRALPAAELASLIQQLPGLTAELRPDAALVPARAVESALNLVNAAAGTSSALADALDGTATRATTAEDLLAKARGRLGELAASLKKAEASKAGPKTGPTRLAALAHAFALKDASGLTWKQVLGYVNEVAEQLPDLETYSNVENLKTAVSRAKGDPRWTRHLIDARKWVDEEVAATKGEGAVEGVDE